MKEFRNPPNVHAPQGAYTHHVEITENERMLILSGQVGMREDGTIPEDVLEQMEVAFENIFRNLRAAGMDVPDILKLTYYVVGDMDMTKRREIITAKLQGHKPCSTFLYVAGLASPAYKVEVEAIASRAG
jgi:2-iminobutanoate/2-iminopropanoate deaminase